MKSLHNTTQLKRLVLTQISFIALLVTIFVYTHEASAMNRTSRLGLGYSSQFQTNLDAISFKIQKSRGMSFGGIFGYNSGDAGGFGAGVKLYKILFDEPKLDFYAAAMAALLSKKTAGVSESGFQVDLTLGSEFSFEGIESLGFSMEFGLSINKISEFEFETTGASRGFVIGAIHFYL